MTDLENSETEIIFNYKERSSPLRTECGRDILDNESASNDLQRTCIDDISQQPRGNNLSCYSADRSNDKNCYPLLNRDETQSNISENKNEDFRSESLSIQDMEDQQSNSPINECMSDIKEQQKEITNVLKQMMILMSKQNERNINGRHESDVVYSNTHD